MGVLGEPKGVVLTGPPDRSIFDFSRYVRRAPLSEPAADLLSFNGGKGLTFDAWNSAVPESVWARFATEPSTRVVIDASGEGVPHHEGQTSDIHAFLRAKGVPIERGVYLTQHRPYAAEYDAACRLAGETQRMRVINADYFIRRFFVELSEGAAEYEIRLDRFRRRAAHRERAMVNLNLTLRPAKVLFLLRLLRDGLWDRGFISVGAREVLNMSTSATDGLWEAQIETLHPYLEQLKAKAGFTFEAPPVGEKGEHFSRVFGSVMGEYDRSWFTVITETEMLDGPSRITEKALKALVNFHPVIFLGNAGALPLLRELNFRSFEGFFDERYDAETSAERRFDLVFEQIVRLLRMDDAELARRTEVVTEALLHNAQWGLTRLPKHYRKHIDLKLIQDVMS